MGSLGTLDNRLNCNGRRQQAYLQLHPRHIGCLLLHCIFPLHGQKQQAYLQLLPKRFPGICVAYSFPSHNQTGRTNEAEPYGKSLPQKTIVVFQISLI